MKHINQFMDKVRQDPTIPKELIEEFDNCECQHMMGMVLSRNAMDKMKLFKILKHYFENRSSQPTTANLNQPTRRPGRPQELKTLATAKPTNEKAQQRLKESYMATVATELKQYLSIEHNPYNRPAVTTFGGVEYVVTLYHKNGECLYKYDKVYSRPNNMTETWDWVFNGQGYAKYLNSDNPSVDMFVEEENQPIRIEVDPDTMLTPSLAPEINDDQILILKYGTLIARESASVRDNNNKQSIANAEMFIKEEKPEAYKYLKRIPNAYLNDYI